jgi:hypothetical protein
MAQLDADRWILFTLLFCARSSKPFPKVTSTNHPGASPCTHSQTVISPHFDCTVSEQRDLFSHPADGGQALGKTNPWVKLCALLFMPLFIATVGSREIA